MSEQSWKPLFRTPTSTVTKVLRSPAFVHSRERAYEIIEDPTALRRLAETVEAIDHAHAPLAAIADRVAAAVRFLDARADRLDRDGGNASAPPKDAVGEARERLLVASLHYLVTPVDLVPDFRVGGYIDDVLLLSWAFGAAVNELEPYLDDEQED